MAKAWTVNGLERSSVFRDAAGRIIITRWCEMMSYRDGTLSGEDIEDLHAMRVSSRRLRAAMDAFAAAFPAKSYRRKLRMVKRVTDTLGDARDLDVAVATLTARLPEMEPDERPGLEGLIARYRQRRAEEAPHIAALFDEIDRTDFEQRFIGYVERHTGVRRKRLAPRPPEVS